MANEQLRAKLFLFYKIFFSILIIPAVGIVVYNTLKSGEENRPAEEETYFQDEAKFLKTKYGEIINKYLQKNITGSEQIKYIEWTHKPVQLRAHTDIMRVKYSIKKPSGELSIFDMVFVIEDGTIAKDMVLD